MKIRILLMFLLLSSSLIIFFPIHAKAQNPGEIVDIGVPLVGEISHDNEMDTYGLETLEPGIYNISLESVGGALLRFEVFRYFNGGPEEDVTSTQSNGSRIFVVYDNPEIQVYHYFLRIRVWGGSIYSNSGYIALIEASSLPYSVEMNTDYQVDLSETNTIWHTFHCNGESAAYWFFFDVTFIGPYDDIWIEIYNQEGFEIWWDYTDTDVEIVLLLDPGDYYIYFNHYSEVEEVAFRIEPFDIESITPDTTRSFSLHNSLSKKDHSYFQFEVKEGVYYEIILEVGAYLNAGFAITQGEARSSRLVFDESLVGGTEQVSDLIFYGQYSMHTLSDERPCVMGAHSVIRDSYTFDGIDYSKTLIEVYDIVGGGPVNLTVRELEPASTWMSNSDGNLSFDNENGPYWYLFKVPNLEPMKYHKLRLDTTSAHTPEFYVWAELYKPMLSEDYYLDGIRPFLSDYTKALVDPTLTYGATLSSYYTFDDTVYYHPAIGACWLLLEIDWDSHVEMSGICNLSITECESYNSTIGDSFTVDDEYCTINYNLQAGIYQFTVRGYNYSSSGNIYGLHNSSGHSAHLVLYYDDHQDIHSRNYTFRVRSVGTYTLLVLAYGDCPITITTTVVQVESPPYSESTINTQTPTTPGTDLSTPMALSLIVSTIGALVIGFGLGRIRFGDKSELHLP